MKTLTKTLLAATFAIASFSAFADTEIDLTKYEGEWKFDSQSVAAKHFPKTANLSITLQEGNKKKCGKSYANNGQIKRVANSTFIITPYNVDIMGDLLDELENNGAFY